MVATTAKVVQVSSDGGSNYFTLPGGTGEFNDDAGAIDDTIFGAVYSSFQPGLLGFSANANALYKGFAGYVAKILQPGAPTAFTTEACTLVTGKIFKIDDITKNVWDRATPVVVFDNAIDHTVDVLNIDYLFGRVEFKTAYSVTEPITVTGESFPMTQLGKGRTFTLTQTAAVVDDTDFASAQVGSGYRSVLPGLKSVALELGGVYDVTEGLRALLQARSETIIEINPDGAGLSNARGFFKPATEAQSGNVGDLEDETTTFTLFVPDEALMLTPFNWIHDNAVDPTTLSQAVRIILQSWLDGTIIDVNYLYDGVNGQTGKVIVTDVSLTGGLEVMNEFAATFMGDENPSVVGTG
jgi:hypothetical protein